MILIEYQHIEATCSEEWIAIRTRLSVEVTRKKERGQIHWIGFPCRKKSVIQFRKLILLFMRITLSVKTERSIIIVILSPVFLFPSFVRLIIILFLLLSSFSFKLKYLYPLPFFSVCYINLFAPPTPIVFIFPSSFSFRTRPRVNRVCHPTSSLSPPWMVRGAQGEASGLVCPAVTISWFFEGRVTRAVNNQAPACIEPGDGIFENQI
jgi:hypothetical protein